MTVEEVCRAVEESKIVLFESGCVFSSHVCEIRAGEPVPEKYANRKVFQLEGAGEGVIYLVMDKQP